MHHYNRLKKFLLSKAVLPATMVGAFAFLILTSVTYVEGQIPFVDALTNPSPSAFSAGSLFSQIQSQPAALCCGGICGTCSASVYVTGFTHSGGTYVGTQGILNWSSSGADYCGLYGPTGTIPGGISLGGGKIGGQSNTDYLQVSPNGSLTLNPYPSNGNYNFQVICINSGGANSGNSTPASLNIAVAPTQPRNDITVSCGGNNELGCPGGVMNNAGQISIPNSGSKSVSINMSAAAGAGDAIVASAIVQLPGNGSMGSVNPDNYPIAPGSYGNAQVARSTGAGNAYSFTVTPTTPPGVYYFYAVSATNNYAWNKYPPSPGGWSNIASVNVVPPAPPAAPAQPTYSCNAAGTQVTISWNTVPNATKYGPRIANLQNSSCNAGWSHTAPGSAATCYYDNQTTTSFTQTAGIVPSASYTAWVHAGNAGGFSPASPGLTFSCSAAAPTDLCPSLTGTQTSYPTGSSPANSCTCPSGTTYNQTGNACQGSASGNTLGIVSTANPSEPTTSGSFVLTRTGATTQPMDLTFAISGTATRNTDYALYAQNVSGADCIINPGTPNDVRIPLGLSSCTVKINPINDSIVETGGETVTFKINAAPSGYSLIPPQATALLGDDDSAATDVCPSLAGNQATYPSGSSPVGSCTCPAGSSYNLASNTCSAPTVPIPTMSITGNGQTGEVTAQIGQPVVIRGTYAAGTGDALVFTALNDNNNNPLPGVPNTTAASPKTYTFTPTGAGTFVFYPSVRTAAYPSWNNYGHALYVNVDCPAGQTQQGNAGCVPVGDVCQNIGGTQNTPPNNGYSRGGVCGCDEGYELSGSSCVEQAENVCGANQIPSSDGESCTCEVGYSMDDGQCVQQACPGPNETNWPSCSCAGGFVRDGGTNMCIREAVLNIQVNDGATARVRKGNTVSLTWSASGVTSGSCSVRSNTAGVLSTGISGSLNPVVGSQTTYTLRCLNDAGGVVSKTATVTLIPTVDEI